MRGRVLLGGALVLAPSGCFALFPLDDFGPGGPDAGRADGAQVGAAVDASEEATAVDAGPRRLVFVTSESFGVGGNGQGLIDGVGTATTRCTAAASNARLTGAFRAWLAQGTSSPPFSFEGRDGGPPLRLLDGTLVAEDYDELFATGPRVPIALTETGATVHTSITTGSGNCAGSDFVWTGATNTGSHGDDCNNWDEVGKPFMMVYGLAGAIADTVPAGGWTNACKLACMARARLYCFEQ